MRIGIDVRVFEPAGPGQQRYLWRLGIWLASRGHECAFLTVRRQPPDVDAPEGVTLHRLDRCSRADLRDRVRALELDVLLLNPERSRRYRGVQANVLRSGYGTDHYRQNLRSFRSPLEAAGRRALRLAPWVLAERRWERAYYERPTPPPDVIAQSAYMREEILGTYAVPPEHVHVVRNGVDPFEFSPARRASLRDSMRERWRIPADATCLLFVGHNFRLKGLWQLLSALSRLDDAGRVHLLVVGRGTGPGQRRKAERLVERLGLTDRVTLAGEVASSLEAHAAADALLHLSWHDSFGFVALEAMACGLPVVTTRYAGAAELIEHGVSGLLVDPGDVRRLAEAIALLSDADARERIGSAAAEIAAHHGEVGSFTGVLGVLAQATERGRGPVV